MPSPQRMRGALARLIYKNRKWTLITAKYSELLKNCFELRKLSMTEHG